MNVMRRTLHPAVDIGVILLCGLLLAAPAAAQQEAASSAATPETLRVIQVKILGMSCPFCAYGVEQKLKKLDGVEQLTVELESGIATLTMEAGADVSNRTLKETVEDAGFEPAAIARSFASEHEDWHPEELPSTIGAATGRDTASSAGPDESDG